MQPSNPAVPDSLERAWWKSKKLMALAANHSIVFVLSVFGIIKQPSATGTIVTGTLAELGTVTAAHATAQAATERAQAYSPNYPSTPAYGPPLPPPPSSPVGPKVP